MQISQLRLIRTPALRSAHGSNDVSQLLITKVIEVLALLSTTIKQPIMTILIFNVNICVSM